jgi:hypothetical protein
LGETYHFDTINYNLNIRSNFFSICIGAVLGSLMGSLLRNLSGVVSQVTAMAVWQAVIVGGISSLAVVIAFARKTAAQPMVSIEDFWGGTLIGFSVGFFGFEKFLYLFTNPSSTASH